jgi:1,4-alpha-glucan branching enzyme
MLAFIEGRPVDGMAATEPGQTIVRFALPPTSGAEVASLIGSFDNWAIIGRPMQRLDDGSFELTLSLPRGRRYEFRYLLDGYRWENDPEADDYAPNAYGGYNSVIHT